MNDSPLNDAIRHFEAVEANLIKLEMVLDEIETTIPQGIVFGENHNYEDNCRSFRLLFESLPKIDQWKPNIILMELNEIAQSRFDAQEIGEMGCIISTEEQINEPSRLLKEYRFRFKQKRRELIRDSLLNLIDSIDGNLRELSKLFKNEFKSNEYIDSPDFEKLKLNVAQITTLLGSSVALPPRWSYLHRHIGFGMLNDLHDIIETDWPSVKSGLRKSLYGEKEPVPVNIEDLGSLVSSKPTGIVATKLNWKNLTPEDFERLIFALISYEKDYENPEWLMKTNAPDRGRDLSVYRVHNDSLGGTFRQRTIIQCKHWLSKSVSISEISDLKIQMKLWEPPKVDIHIIATTGRFTSDAVASIESHNQSDSGLKIEMWPDSHLERLLSSRPALIAEFGLR